MRTTQSESGAVAESDLARRNAERRLFGSLGTQSDRIRQEMQRYASMRDPTLRYMNILQYNDWKLDINHPKILIAN